MPDTSSPSPWAQLGHARAELLELLALAGALALGVDLFGHTIYDRIPHLFSLLLGAILVITPLFLLWYRRLSELHQHITLSGAFLYRSDDNSLLEIPEYGLATKISEYIDAALYENAALRQQWDSEPLARYSEPTHHNETGEHIIFIQRRTGHKIEYTPYMRLVDEVVQYIILEVVSDHISEYFNRHGLIRDIKEYAREDIPQLLLTNRLIDLFTRPPEDRPLLYKHLVSPHHGEEVDDGEIVTEAIHAHTAEGFIYYERLHLVLPTGSTITSYGRAGLKIDSKLLTISIEPMFLGLAGDLSPEFLWSYVGLDEPWREIERRVHVYSCPIHVSIRVKRLALVLRKSWQYHGWAESIRDRLLTECDIETFLHSIGWRGVETALHADRKRQAKREAKNRRERNMGWPGDVK